jgi:hypothetical protein
MVRSCRSSARPPAAAFMFPRKTTQQAAHIGSHSSDRPCVVPTVASHRIALEVRIERPRRRWLSCRLPVRRDSHPAGPPPYLPPTRPSLSVGTAAPASPRPATCKTPHVGEASRQLRGSWNARWVKPVPLRRFVRPPVGGMSLKVHMSRDQTTRAEPAIQRKCARFEAVRYVCRAITRGWSLSKPPNSFTFYRVVLANYLRVSGGRSAHAAMAAFPHGVLYKYYIRGDPTVATPCASCRMGQDVHSRRPSPNSERTGPTRVDTSRRHVLTDLLCPHRSGAVLLASSSSTST